MISIKNFSLIFSLFITMACLTFSVAASTFEEQQDMLKSSSPSLTDNKKIVFDFYRVVFEALHMEKAADYLTPEYIQHNPNVSSGRDGFIQAFSKRGEPKTIENHINAPLISIIAEDDIVVFVFSREYPEPADSSKKYQSTWFDMFRIENGMIAEHWDPAIKKTSK
ncbi:nuclear transport factor 2 family protein [Shewanella mangrovisoli]|uniref:nuclear transport factor 2 family protein n=1 Tax=Shewanella mangrovisoli TaxID=2864211 RepID=UPI0035BA4FE2